MCVRPHLAVAARVDVHHVVPAVVVAAVNEHGVQDVGGGVARVGRLQVLVEHEPLRKLEPVVDLNVRVRQRVVLESTTQAGRPGECVRACVCEVCVCVRCVCVCVCAVCASVSGSYWSLQHRWGRPVFVRGVVVCCVHVCLCVCVWLLVWLGVRACM